jgi:acyl-coenzyme A synthetase/AMP-(fatty) acid ligase
MRLAITLPAVMSISYLVSFQKGKPIGTPDPSSYYRMLTDHRIAAMFVAPTAMRALRKEVQIEVSVSFLAFCQSQRNLEKVEEWKTVSP